LFKSDSHRSEMALTLMGIEVDWTTVFPAAVEAVKRLGRAQTLADANGKHSTGAVVQAINEIAGVSWRFYVCIELSIYVLCAAWLSLYRSIP
jgi:hypothetical protein